MDKKSKYFEYEERIRKAYDELKKSYQEVKDSYTEMIFRLALVAEFKDETTGTHLVRIADYSTEIGHGLNLSEKDIDLLKYASPMHDIGKIVVPDCILKKPALLTSDEMDVIKKHTRMGADIFEGSRAPLLRAVRDICLYHHEKYDGTGYPQGIKGKAIPIFGRIVALADVFDALTTVRPYKKALDFDEAVNMVRDDSGTHFDPKVVHAFIKRIDNIREIWKAAKDIEFFVSEKEEDEIEH